MICKFYGEIGKSSQNLTAFRGGEGRDLYTGQYLCLEYSTTVVQILNHRNRKQEKTENIVQCKLTFYFLETTKKIIKRGSFHDVEPLAI